MIATAILVASVLTVALTQCGVQPAPATEMPTPKAATIAPAGGATEDSGTLTAATDPIPTPLPTLTAEELLARELIEPGGQVTFSADECSHILETEPWCSVIKSAKPITRPEWAELLPKTEFFSVRVDVYGGEFSRYRNWLIMEQDGQRYTADTFDRLLAANGITEITDEDRELVAKSFVLMTLANYLEEEISFTKWEKVERPPANVYNRLEAWTKIQGLEIEWYFVFRDGRLRAVNGPYLLQYQVGDYIDKPELNLPPIDSYAFR